MKLVGLMGVKRAGKDTVAEIIMSEDRRFERVGFADLMREMLLALDPYVEVIPNSESEFPGTYGGTYARLTAIVDERGWEDAKAFPDVRRLMQRFGTDCVRDHLGQDTWVDTTFDTKVIPMLNSGHNVVMTDVRFTNEIARIRESGGEIWRIDRPSLPVDTTTEGVHQSEVEWRKAKPDVVITNRDGRFDLLRADVADALEAALV